MWANVQAQNIYHMQKSSSAGQVGREIRILLIAITCFLFGCSDQKKRAPLLSSSADKIVNIQGDVLGSASIVNSNIVPVPLENLASRIYFVSGHLVLSQKYGGYALQIFDIESQSSTYKVPKGEGPGEFFSLYDLELHGNYVHLHGRMLQKVLTYEIDSLISHSVGVAYNREIRLCNQVNEIACLKNGVFWATSYSSDPLKRFTLMDSIGDLAGYEVDYPNTELSGIDVIGIPEAYHAGLSKHPSKDLLVLSNKTCDLIEIIDAAKRKALVGIVGPINEPPRYISEIDEYGGHTLILLEDATRDCYFSPMTTEDGFWVGYDGDFADPSEGVAHAYQSHVKYLMKFDYEGNLLDVYRLDVPVLGRMTLDPENLILYALCDYELDLHVRSFSLN